MRALKPAPAPTAGDHPTDWRLFWKLLLVGAAANGIGWGAVQLVRHPPSPRLAGAMPAPRETNVR